MGKGQRLDNALWMFDNPTDMHISSLHYGPSIHMKFL